MSNKKEIKPIFIAYPGIYSLLMLNYLVYKKKVRFAGIVLSVSHIKMRGIYFSFLESFYILIKRSGLWYTLYMFFILRFSFFIFGCWRLAAFFSGRRLYFESFRKIARRNNIPLLKIKNINTDGALEAMKNTGANIIVSAYNNQILKYKVCKKFPFKAIGIHNSYLPDFSGLDSAFETLYHRERRSGATIHYIDANIDTGKILKQEHITVRSNDSVFSLNIRQWLHGAKMLPGVLEAIQNQTIKPRKQNFRYRRFVYRSFPERKYVIEALARGQRLITWKDIFVPSAYIYALFGDKKRKKNR